MNRRLFLERMLAAGSMMALGDFAAFQKVEAATTTTAAIDEDLWVFVSDLHVHPEGYQPEQLRKVVNEILRMNPLPSAVIEFGDLAYLTGRVEEYELAKEILAPIEAAGIRLVLGMGNHDRREEFAQVFPEHAAQSLLKHRYVNIVEGKYADLIMLDTLNQGDDKSTWITPGTMDEEQRTWLANTLANYKKPVFVASHHPIKEVGIANLLFSAPTCVGYVHGHDHRWLTNWLEHNYGDTHIIPTLCLPSTGHWGDIGFVTLRQSVNEAVAQLHQNEFFFPYPVAETDKPKQWDVIVEDHKNLKCTFVY